MNDKTQPTQPDEPDELYTQPLPHADKPKQVDPDEMATAPVPDLSTSEQDKAWEILSKPLIIPPNKRATSDEDMTTAPVSDLAPDALSKPLTAPPTQPTPLDDDTRTMPIGLASNLLSKPPIVPPYEPAESGDETKTMPIPEIPSFQTAESGDETKTMPIPDMASKLSEPLIIPPSRPAQPLDDDDTRTMQVGGIASELLSKPSLQSMQLEGEAGDNLRTMPMSTQPNIAPNTLVGTPTITPDQAIPRRTWLQTARRQLRTQMNPSIGRWIEVVYSPDIDKLLAETALEDDDPAVAEQAARTIGRIRSQAAVAEIVRRQRAGAQGALRALAVVRDEAASLPSSVAWWARLFAWLTNTWRRLSENPNRSTLRFIFASIGAALAFGVYTWVGLPGLSFFTPDRWSKSISYGLTIGVLYGLRALLAGEYPSRMRGFHPWWGILAWSLVAGVTIGALTWGAFTWLILQNPVDWNLMIFAGLGGAVGLSLTALFRLPGLVAVALDAASIWLPLYIAWSNYWAGTGDPIIYFNRFDGLQVQLVFEGVYTLLIPMCIAIAVGAHFQTLLQDFAWLTAPLRRVVNLWLSSRRALRRRVFSWLFRANSEPKGTP